MSAPRSPERGETLPATHAVFATASSPPHEGVFPGTGSMQLAHLSLTTFRNYKSLEISFSPTHHLFIGQNGEGKTNLLESIHVLGCGSSMRGARDRTLVQHGERGFSVGGRLIDERRSGSAGLRAEVHYECGSGRETGSKRILVDRAPARASDLLAQVKVVPFAPADLELVQGAGAVRRRYLSRYDGLSAPVGIPSRSARVSKSAAPAQRDSRTLLPPPSRKIASIARAGALDGALDPAWRRADGSPR
jgi:hypothetical protein